jgi:deazaflavin-dependent oxidoreductase (nitroreductase family)
MATAPRYPAPGTWQAKVANQVGNLHTLLNRVSGGRLGNSMQGGAPVLFLEHVGRKSGKTRTAPLLYIEDGPKLVIVASRGGSDAPPAWWLNLRDAGRGEVRLNGETRQVVPRLATEEERQAYWPRLTEIWPDYDIYTTRTDRQIPVIVLEPAA